MYDYETKSMQLSDKMAEMRRIKPRPLDKLYGKNGPTPEQLAQYNDRVKQWNREYRRLSNQHKEQLEIDNAAFRARQGK